MDRCFHTKIASYRHPQQTVDQQKPEQGPERPVSLSGLALACHKSFAEGGNCYRQYDACREDMPICGEQPAQIVSLRVNRRTAGDQLSDRAPFAPDHNQQATGCGDHQDETDGEMEWLRQADFEEQGVDEPRPDYQRSHRDQRSKKPSSRPVIKRRQSQIGQVRRQQYTQSDRHKPNQDR